MERQVRFSDLRVQALEQVASPGHFEFRTRCVVQEVSDITGLRGNCFGPAPTRGLQQN